MTPPKRLLHDALRHAARAAPDKVALRVGDEACTYAELEESATRLAAALQARGFRRGDRGAVFMDNTLPCVVAIYAVLKAGGVFLVVNPQTKQDKLGFVLNDCEVRMLLTDANLAEVVNGVVHDVPSLTHVVASGAEVSDALEWGGKAPELVPLNEALSTPAEEWRRPGTIPLDLAALIYTSGSTGNPKGVMHTHQTMTFTVGSLVEYLRLSSDDVLINVLPLAFDYGLYQLFMAVDLAATLVLERSFAYPAQILNRMREHEVTVFPGVPTVYSMLMAAHVRQPLAFPSVRRVTNTAAALPTEYFGALREIFPNALIFPMYGLTECKRVSYLEPELIDSKPGSVGKAIPGTEVLLLDGEGREVPPGEAGILHVRGPHVMLGYWNNTEETVRMLQPGPMPGERMLRTGDWFRTDDEGFLYFVGRSDDIIKTRGEKVSPLEVEQAFYSITEVREVAVVGVPDGVLGEAVRAYVVLAPGAEPNERRLRRELTLRLENFMVPKEIVFMPELPKTANGKIARRELV